MDLSQAPLWQAIQQRSIKPMYQQFTNGMFLNNVARGIPGLALSMTGYGAKGMPNPRTVTQTPYGNLSPSVEGMLKQYSNRQTMPNPANYYKNGAGYFDNTNPLTRRAMAASYLSKFKK